MLICIYCKLMKVILCLLCWHNSLMFLSTYYALNCVSIVRLGLGGTWQRYRPPAACSSLPLPRREAVSLQQKCQLQAAELALVRRLARRILDQRSEVEHFLLDALQYVRKEVAANR